LGEDGITPRVKQFITEHIDSVMQLEILLLLAGQPGKVWTAAELAQLLRIDAAWVDGQLRSMGGRGVIGVAEGSPPEFRYEARSAELAATVTELARAYADRRVTVIGLIFSKPIDKIRSFADAFRLRKDKSDG
jgi:hypothetical protein